MTGLDECGPLLISCVDGGRGACAGGLRLCRQPRAGAGIHAARRPASRRRSRRPTSSNWSASQLDSVFVAASAPRDVRVSPPRRQSTGWAGPPASGPNSTRPPASPWAPRPIASPSRTGRSIDRRHVEADDNCASENLRADLAAGSIGARSHDEQPVNITAQIELAAPTVSSNLSASVRRIRDGERGNAFAIAIGERGRGRDYRHSGGRSRIGEANAAASRRRCAGTARGHRSRACGASWPAAPSSRTAIICPTGNWR